MSILARGVRPISFVEVDGLVIALVATLQVLIDSITPSFNCGFLHLLFLPVDHEEAARGALLLSESGSRVVHVGERYA